MSNNTKEVKAPKNKRPATSTQHAQALMDASAEFERNDKEKDRSRNKFLYVLSAGCLVIAALAVGAVFFLMPLKTTETQWLLVDKATGAMEVIEKLTDAKVTQSEVVDKYFIGQYIRFRESYDWRTLQSTYDAVLLMSDTKVANEYRAVFAADNAPHKVLKDSVSKRPVILSISFVGDMAQVRFEVHTTPNNGQLDAQPIITRWVATLAYKYADAPTKQKDRQVNPVGFKIKSYRVDPEAI